MSQQPSEDSVPPSDEPGSAIDQLFRNAALGSNHWWRWILGLILIVAFWLGLGTLLQAYGCAYIERSNLLGVTCGDSFVVFAALAGLGFALGLAGVWITAHVLHRKELKRFVTGRTSFDFSRYFFGVLAALTVSVVKLLVNRFVVGQEMTFQPPGGEFLLFLVVAVILVPVQSGFEEVFFRGYILQGLMQFLRNKVVLAILTGVIFALPHLANPEPWSYGIAPYVTALIASGLFFGIVVLSDGGLELALGYHAMSNLFIGLVANTESAAIASPSLFLVQVDRYLLFPNVLVDVLILVLALAILNHKYKWVKIGK